MKPQDFGENWTKWDSLMQAHCIDAQAPWQWLKAIMIDESSLGLNPRVVLGLLHPEDIEGSKSEDGLSYGLLQLRPETARDFDIIANAQKLNDPDYSIRIGAKLLRRLFRALGGVEEFVMKAWNEGQGAAVLEQSGRIHGRADEYWTRYQANKAMILASGENSVQTVSNSQT
jgi:soluble lytic murein transglycosylase-like protein